MILGNPPGPAAPLPGPKGGESFLIEAVDYAGTFFWERPVFLLISETVSPSIDSRTTPRRLTAAGIFTLPEDFRQSKLVFSAPASGNKNRSFHPWNLLSEGGLQGLFCQKAAET